MKTGHNSLKIPLLIKALKFLWLAVLCSGGLLLLNAKQADDAAQIDGHDWADIEALVGDGDSATNDVGDYKFSMQDENHGKWLMCDGQAVSRSTYADLFELIGIQFGEGDQINTFNLPDARSRLVGVASHPSVLASDESRPTEGPDTELSPRVIGDMTGTETHTLTEDEMPLHGHPALYSHEGNSGTRDTNGAIFIDNSQRQFHNARTWTTGGETTNKDAANTNSIGGAGGGNAHNNMPPSLFIGNMFIYSGVSTTSSALDSLTQ